MSVGFLALAPGITLCLLKLKDFPSFPGADWINALPWIYRALWFPSLLAGIALGVVLAFLTRLTDYLYFPYDAGRALSFGAIGGSIAQTVTVAAQQLWQRHALPHPFWLATGTITGCLCGALTAAIVLRRVTRPASWEVHPRPWILAVVTLTGLFLVATQVNYWLFAGCLVSSKVDRRVTAQQLALHISTSPRLLSRSLLPFLRSKRPDRRLRAAEALGILGQTNSTVILALEHRLNDPDPAVRETAETALQRLKTEAALPGH